jgi:hypothetical protein
MQISSIAKYGFRIRTRNGAVVDNLLIYGKNEPDAERKLRQIYLGCEIIEVKRLVPQPQRSNPVSYEDVVDLITGMPGL